MKRIALVCAAIVLAACTTDKETPAADTTTPAMAPAPATTDTMMMDSTQMDSTAADTTARP